MAVQHRQQHRQTVLLQPDREPARVRRVRRIHQRLDLDQQRPGSFDGGQHAGAGNLLFMIG